MAFIKSRFPKKGKVILTLFSLEYVFLNSLAYIAAMVVLWLECLVMSAFLLVWLI